MRNLCEQLQQCFRGRVCLMGLGNVDYGDDAWGVRLAEALVAKSEFRNPKFEDRNISAGNADSNFGLRASFGFRDSSFGFQDVIITGTTPERHLTRLAEGGFDNVVFLDAVEFGGTPGSVVFLNAGEMAARFPQISTHKISLGVLAKWVEANGTTKAWLLGVQPESLKPGGELTPQVQATLDVLQELLTDISVEVFA
jgi:hydrogenase maturation protease